MTAKRFRFVSPGVKINEIDRSVLTANIGAIGPVVVGRFQHGPGMVPVTVESYIDFDNTFGSPTRGVVNSTRSDVWRTGQLQSPTYAAYAAEAWLKNSSPLTAVRLLGVEHPQRDNIEEAKAGWVAGSGEASSQGGAWGIFVAPSGSNVTGALAAVIYLATGSLELVGTDLTGSSMVSGTNVFVKSTGDDFEFRLKVMDGASTKVDTAFNLNKASAKHIRKVLNTNPVLTNSDINPPAIVKNYWLGETFETFVREEIGTGSAAATGQVMATLVALQDVSSANLGDHLGVQAQPAKTGWVIAQDLDAPTNSFDPSLMSKLFRFSTLGGEEGDSSGEWEQKNVKVSIEDIKPSNSSFNKYGSFTVKVRKLYDSDKRQEVLETFTNCNLDPTSPNFIAKLIGDKMTIWDDVEAKHRTIGNFDNNSNFIRVEMDSLLEQGALDAQLLPFGFFGPPQFVSAKLAAGVNSEVAALFSGSVSNPVDVELLFPTIPMVESAAQRGATTHFGINCSLGANGVFNEDVLDLLRAKPAGFDSYEVDPLATGSQNSPVFTLDDVSASVDSTTLAVWVPGSRAAGDSFTATGSDVSYKNVLNAGFNRFTMPLFGGTDGVRVTEKDPFRNSFLANAGVSDIEGKTNYALYSLRRAIAAVADPETLDMNLMTVPGVTDEKVTNRVIEVCESRADALAIIDVAGGYIPDAETNLVEKDNLQERLGSVTNTINAVKARDFNSSYACAYYPWVKIKDQRENGDLWVPPSVVALGTMASSQEVSAVWFAPAGFNRGGLDRGSAGLTVTDVREVLKATQRDDLYEVNINPIARFPAEGIVIFGQKTLQATPSALDRINVRRLVLFLKKQISGIASGLLFDQNIKTTWQRFLNQVNPLMESTKSGGGIVDYKVVLDETTTTPDLIDRNTMYAKIFIKPAYAIEFIGIDFVITNSGASFDDL
jgi:hypothetical protein